MILKNIDIFIFEKVGLKIVEFLYGKGILSVDLTSRYAYWISKKYEQMELL